MRAQKCFAVKRNLNGLLDVSRKTYTEMIEDIHSFYIILKLILYNILYIYGYKLKLHLSS